MNEVTRIHLGREPFTIAVEAHKSLKAYLADIEKKVHDKEVLSEVELRMSELLLERGVSGEKVVLPEDVQYLKDQLGDPDDFSEDEKDVAEEYSKSDDKASRKLFRDTDNSYIAGVASGLANYTGLDVTIVRLLFVVVAIFGSGLGIAIYLVLWLVLPPAETTSEKLQMQGKNVTLEALKESVNRADINGAAKRINNRILPIINGVFRLAIKCIGLGFVLAGFTVLSAISVLKIYMLLHHGQLFQENLFPVGAREQWLLALTMGLMVIAAIFMILTGISAFKRAWPVRGWITSVLLGVFLVGSVATVALTADAVPRVRERYETTLHTTAIKNIQPFSKVETTGEVDISYISSPDYAVNIHYSGKPDLSKIKIRVTDNVLHVDSTSLDSYKHCTMLCLFPRYNMTVQVYAPNIEKFNTPPNTDIFYPDVPTAPIAPVSSEMNRKPVSP
jgi:phage shock protein PspC (stress-responsive transcriptional regulator)